MRKRIVQLYCLDCGKKFTGFSGEIVLFSVRFHMCFCIYIKEHHPIKYLN
ncbi:MAG: hypothetical protein HQ536_02855 [Parcubacteria group bacterium]|nr:hypothetical protein [Parcubacteria group bacterium]